MHLFFFLGVLIFQSQQGFYCPYIGVYPIIVLVYAR